jgi:NAD(P)-dependent dehydrogenase (short-subunit alcohol dehydrogenase family)
MTSVFSATSEMTPEEYKRVTEVTYLGTAYGTLAAPRGMLPRDQGRIIQIGSALAYRRTQEFEALHQYIAQPTDQPGGSDQHDPRRFDFPALSRLDAGRR